MRDEFDILQGVTGKSQTGAPKIDWETIGTMRGILTPLSGAELFQGEQAGHQLTHRIRSRFNRELDTTMKLGYRDSITHKYRRFELTVIMDVQNRHTQLDILAKEEL